jgi:hypothetical protein
LEDFTTTEQTSVVGKERGLSGEKMDIKLDEKHTLHSDKYCYWITVDFLAKNGKLAQRRISGYCPTFEEAVINFFDRDIAGLETGSAGTILRRIADTKKLIKKWCEEVKK